MDIVSAKIDWMEEYANTPHMTIEAISTPSLASLRFEERNSCYYAEQDGYVKFYYYERPGNGFGGSSFEITMKNGSKRTLKGPWSSRAGAMNMQGFGPCVDVAVRAHIGSNKGYLMGAAVSLEIAKAAAKMAGAELRCYTHHGRDMELTWYPWCEKFDHKFKDMRLIEGA